MINDNLPPHEQNDSAPAPLSNRPPARPLPKGRQGRKDKRSRTEPSGDVPVKITEETVVWLRLVDKYRLLDAKQLYASVGGDWNPRAFSKRLDNLFHAEGGSVLHRPPAQFRGGEPARPYIYAVGPQGRQVLDKLDGIERRSRRDFKAENDRLG